MAYSERTPIRWDEAKNRANQRKHGISFDEASELFSSPAGYLEMFDEEHSDMEDRFIAIGPIFRGVVLVVWVDRDDETIRIMSARFATRRERRLYEERSDRTP